MKDFTWLQHVTFTYTYLCLFDDIRRTIHSQLPDDTLVDNIYNPINIHKCIIVPSYAIGTYFSSSLRPSNFDITIQHQTNCFWRRQSSISILYTNEYIVKYFGFLQTINKQTLTALGRIQFYDTKKIKPDEHSTSINATFFKDILPQTRMKRNFFILRTQKEVISAKAKNPNVFYMKLEKYDIQFQFKVNHPLMLFFCLIPVAVVDQRPTNLFDIGKKK